jgi:hypothetical protein
MEKQMELYKTVTLRLKQLKMSKREFARRLIEREIRSRRTGSIVSEKIIYSYLDGTTAMVTELIPYIAEILDITEQELFDDTEPKRLKQLRHILKNPSENEKKTAALLLKEQDGEGYGFPTDFQLGRLAELLPYAPTVAVEKITQILARYKKLFEEMEREG